MAIQPYDDLAVGGLYPSVHGLGYARAWMRQAPQPQVGMVLLITTDDVHCPVCRASIDDDDLKNGRLLRPNRVKQCGNAGVLVPAGDDDGHAFMRSSRVWSHVGP
jgi:hypothetical protein